MNKLFRMRELIEQITRANHAYFVEDAPILSDREYDGLVDELTTIEQETGIHLKSSPIGTVGGGVRRGLIPVQHTKPMLSCNKTKNTHEFLKFMQNHDVVLSWKFDGLTLVLRYENGGFQKAITRGHNGLVGEDVTHTVRELRNIPLVVKCNEPFEVRGEGVLSYEDMNVLGRLQEKHTHPRNMAAGAVRSSVADKGKLFHIDFVAFELMKEDAPATKMEQLAFLKENCFQVVEHCLLSEQESDEEKQHVLEKWVPKEIAYPVDGLVAEYDDIAYGKSLGSTAHHEKRMLALKWQDEVKETIFRGVTLHTTRNGVVTISAEFDEVVLGGSKIHRANVGPLSNFEALQLGVGDVIQVYKANMIIPQIAENLTRSGTYELPRFCPGCGSHIRVEISPTGVKELRCYNPECVSKNAHKIARFCDKNAMNIRGLSATTLEKMVAYGWVHNCLDLYHLQIHEEEIVNSYGFGVEQYNNIISEIEKSRTCSMRQFLVGIGIPELGPQAAKTLHQYFYGSMDEFLKALKEEFCFYHIEGISENLNSKIYEWYEKPFHQDLLAAFMAELTFTGGKKKNTGNQNPFFDKIVAVTGTFSAFEREELIQLLEAFGAMVQREVTREVNYLIYGELPGSKKVGLAMEYGIPLLGEQKFVAMLEQNL